LTLDKLFDAVLVFCLGLVDNVGTHVERIPTVKWVEEQEMDIQLGNVARGKAWEWRWVLLSINHCADIRLGLSIYITVWDAGKLLGI
jgi:hypothetical protein